MANSTIQKLPFALKLQNLFESNSVSPSTANTWYALNGTFTVTTSCLLYIRSIYGGGPPTGIALVPSSAETIVHAVAIWEKGTVNSSCSIVTVATPGTYKIWLKSSSASIQNWGIVYKLCDISSIS